MSVMKMGNIAPRVGIEPTYLAFKASVLTVLPSGQLDLTILHVVTGLCSSLPEKSVQTTTLVLLEL